jgi:hypothetical protein
MLPRAVRRLLLASPPLLLVIAACSSSSSHNSPVDAGTDTGEADAASEAGLPEAAACTLAGLPLVGPQTPTLTAACKSCLGTSCCKEGQACAATADCLALATCVAACPSPVSACAAACETKHPTGVTAGHPFLDCEISVCDLECQSFSCVGKVTWPAPKDPTVTFKYTPTDFSSGKALVGATVKVCPLTPAATDGGAPDAGAADVLNCTTPLATYTTDASGSTMVTAPSSAGGIAAYLEVDASGEMPTLDFLVLPDGNVTLTLTGASVGGVVLSTKIWTELTGAVKITPEPTLGYLAFVANDCSLAGAAGVAVSVSTANASTKTVYLAGGLPSTSAKATDASGEGGVINIPPGPATLTAKDATGTTFSTEPLLFRAGAVTFAAVVVTP